MNTYLTGNPLGSTAAKDLYDNASNMDEGMNSPSPSFTDRFSKRRQSWAGMEAEFRDFLANSQYEYTTPLNYQSGIVLTRPNQVFYKDGAYYRPSNDLALPYTTTGDWTTEQLLFSPITDTQLRTQLSSADSSEGVSLVTGAPRVVDSIVALAGLPTAYNKRAMVLGYANPGDGGGGQYFLDSSLSVGNQGSLVAALDGGGVWQLVHHGEVSLKQFGAGLDSVSDCSAAIQRAFDSVDAFGYPEIYAPAGYYRMVSSVSHSGKPLVFRGAGKADARFAYEGVNFAFNILPSDILQAVHISDLSIIPANTAVPSGRPLNIAWPLTASWSGKTLTLENVNLGSSLAGSSALPYWTAGIKLANAWNGVVRNVWFSGKANDWLTTGNFIELGDNCTDFVIDSCHAYFCVNGIVITGYSEGISVTNSTLVFVYRGVNQPTSSFLNLRFRGNHVNAKGTCFALNNAAQNQINDNLLYLTDSGAVSFGNFVDCNSGNYSHNIMVATGGSPDGFAFAGTSRGNMIIGNNAEGAATSVTLSASTAYNRVAMNARFVAGVPATAVVNSGATNTVTT